MNGMEYISYYHSLPWTSSQLSKIITSYANRFNQYLLDCGLLNNRSRHILLVFFWPDTQRGNFHFLSSLHPNLITQFTIPFLQDRNYFLDSLHSVWQNCSANHRNARQSYELLQKGNNMALEAIANFLNLLFLFPLPIKFVDGFLYKLWKKEEMSDDTFFEVLLSSEQDSSRLPRFAVRRLHSQEWIQSTNGGMWHEQANRDDIQPVTFYRDWIGAVTGVKKIIFVSSKYGLWIPIIKDLTDRKLLGFLHACGENQEILNEYEVFWKDNLSGLREAISNVKI